MMKALPLCLTATGAFLPPRVVTAAEVDVRTGQAAGWTLAHTAVAERRFVTGETAAEMGAAAVRAALEKCGGEVDLLISAAGTPDQPIPCNAALIAAELGWAGVPCFDVNATCLGFIVALDVAASLLAAGRYRRIAIVCAEIASKGLNWAEPEAAALMGDGAAAVVVEAGDGAASLLALQLETWPAGATLTQIRGGGSRRPAVDKSFENEADYRFAMDGPGIFRLAVEKMEPFVQRLLGDSPSRWAEIDLVIPHQGSLPAMRLLRRRLGLPAEKVFEIAQLYGNTIAASMPLALHLAVQEGRLQRGQSVLLLGTSAGFSLGAAWLRY